MTVSFCLESVTIVATLRNDLRFQALVVAAVEEVAEEVVVVAVVAVVEEEAPWSIDVLCPLLSLHHQSQIPNHRALSPVAYSVARDRRRRGCGWKERDMSVTVRQRSDILKMRIHPARDMTLL